MKNYDPNITNGVHTVRITLQSWGYKGHIIQKVGGNCKGRDILNVFDFEDADEDEFKKSDCQLQYHKDDEYYSCVLTDDDGNTLECEEDAEGMNDMIVAVEIIDFRKRLKVENENYCV